MNQKGQAIIILLLIMLVGLTVGLAITQRSLSDLSTSNKVEQSSRAFNAAEAGLEQALKVPCPSPNPDGSCSLAPIDFADNGSSATSISVSPKLPQDSAALEYPQPIGKEGFAHIWLANPTDIDCLS